MNDKLTERERELLEHMKEIKRITALQNSFIVACFTALAIFFQKWWIALFSIFFLVTTETGGDDE